MGSFLTNYQVRSDDAAAVRDAVIPLVQSRAYVSPPKNGWVTIYDEKSDEQNDAVLRKMAMRLSQTLKTSVFAFLVHDSDILAYWLYRGGDLIDEFDSDPEYFGKRVNEATRARVRGNTDALLPLCVSGTTREQIDAVLHDPDGGPVFAEELLTELATLLGIDEARVGVGFRYFNDEGSELLPDIAEFEPIGAGAERKEPTAAHRDEESAPMVNQFAFAVAMLAQEWSVNENMRTLMQFLATQGGSQDPLKKLRAQFDRSAQHVFQHSSLPGSPTFEELKAARDQGPEALAELIARRTPDQLTDIAISAAANSSEQFIAALLRHGLDPTATNAHGMSPLTVAGRNRNSSTYQLLKSAAERQSE